MHSLRAILQTLLYLEPVTPVLARALPLPGHGSQQPMIENLLTKHKIRPKVFIFNAVCYQEAFLDN